MFSSTLRSGRSKAFSFLFLSENKNPPANFSLVGFTCTLSFLTLPRLYSPSSLLDARLTYRSEVSLLNEGEFKGLKDREQLGPLVVVKVRSSRCPFPLLFQLLPSLGLVKLLHLLLDPEPILIAPFLPVLLPVKFLFW